MDPQQLVGKILLFAKVLFGACTCMAFSMGALWWYLCDYRPKAGEDARAALLKAHLLSTQFGFAHVAFGLLCLFAGYAVACVVQVGAYSHTWVFAHVGFHIGAVLFMLAAARTLVTEELPLTRVMTAASWLVTISALLVCAVLIDSRVSLVQAEQQLTVAKLYMGTEVALLVCVAIVLGCNIQHAVSRAVALSNTRTLLKED